MKLREETWIRKGTSLHHPVFGHCRVKWVEGDKFSYIIDTNRKKKVGESADAWGRIVDGKCLEWNSDDEILVVS